MRRTSFRLRGPRRRPGRGECFACPFSGSVGTTLATTLRDLLPLLAESLAADPRLRDRFLEPSVLGTHDPPHPFEDWLSITAPETIDPCPGDWCDDTLGAFNA